MRSEDALVGSECGKARANLHGSSPLRRRWRGCPGWSKTKALAGLHLVSCVALDLSRCDLLLTEQKIARSSTRRRPCQNAVTILPGTTDQEDDDARPFPPASAYESSGKRLVDTKLTATAIVRHRGFLMTQVERSVLTYAHGLGKVNT